MTANRMHDPDANPTRQRTKPGADYMACPGCWELLTRSDIEGFGRCPYCDYPFELDAEMEDFLLQPLVREWTRQSNAVYDER